MNAYEIRLSVLNMAKELVKDQHNDKAEEARENHSIQRDAYFNAIRDDKSKSTDIPQLSLPVFPSSDDVVKKAEELYTFVSKDKGE